MRDHPAHGTTILGSGWGTRLTNETTRNKWKDTWASVMQDPIIWRPRHDWGPDQTFLDR
jgi:hypothetical protein